MRKRLPKTKRMNGEQLAAAANKLCPSYLSWFDWGEVWQQDIKTGVALEWATLAAIAGAASQREYTAEFPLLDYTDGARLFPLRNEIPRHHGAQPGHAAHGLHDAPLSLRFLQALVPKLVLRKEGIGYSLFREGCPYFRIASRINYDERPDILFLPGVPHEGTPAFNGRDTLVSFGLSLTSGDEVTGLLRVRNALTPSCRDRVPQEAVKIPVTGIVECSVNKSAKHASAQLKRYDSLFSSGQGLLPTYLVTGNDIGLLGQPGTVVDLEGASINRLSMDLKRAANGILDAFGLF